MPPCVKYIISSPKGEFPDLDASFMVASWQDLNVSLMRDETSGVMPELSVPIKVALEARTLLKTLFEQHQFAAEAVFSVYVRDWHDLDKYTLATSMRLDFTTYTEDDNYVEISGANAELTEIMKSFGKNKYDIPVVEVRESTKWNYRRMELLAQGIWYPITGINEYGNAYGGRTYWLPVYRDNQRTQQVPGGAEHDMKDQRRGAGIDHFFKADRDVRLTLRLDFMFQWDHPYADSYPWGIFIEKNSGVAATIERVFGTGYTTGRIKEMPGGSVTINLVAGDTLSCIFDVQPDIGLLTADIGFIEDPSGEIINSLRVEYIDRGPAFMGNNAIDVIDPQTLMQKFLDKMAPDRFTCEIEWQDEPAPIRLVSGESLRGYPAIAPTTGAENEKVAYLHGSPNDLLDFMRVLGYEWEIDGTVIRFRRRDEFFRRDITAVALTEKEVANFKVIADGDYAYTKVVIGCEKQDYDSVNGIYEANFVHEYTTGHINTEDSVLDLTSPYRTDPMGIEFLTWERSNKQTDKKADSDIFAVILRVDGTSGTYIEETWQGYTQDKGQPQITMFNALLNPYCLVKRNESLIGIISKKLTFTGTEGNRNAKIVNWFTGEEIDPRQDIVITKKLHDPVMYDFGVGFRRDLPVPGVRNGLVYVPWRGKTYRGFISEISKNHGQETEQTWTLRAVMQ